MYRWIHAAFQIRSGELNETAAFLDGAGDSGAFKAEPVLVSYEPLFIGGRPGCKSIDGWIDEVRVSSKWRYVPRSFTPPRRFERDEHTLALWHFD